MEYRGFGGLRGNDLLGATGEVEGELSITIAVSWLLPTDKHMSDHDTEKAANRTRGTSRQAKAPSIILTKERTRGSWDSIGMNVLRSELSV